MVDKVHLGWLRQTNICPEYDMVKHKHLKFYFSMGHGGNNVTRVVFIKYMMKKPNKMLYLSPKKYLRCGE